MNDSDAITLMYRVIPAHPHLGPDTPCYSCGALFPAHAAHCAWQTHAANPDLKRAWQKAGSLADVLRGLSPDQKLEIRLQMRAAVPADPHYIRDRCYCGNIRPSHHAGCDWVIAQTV